MKKISRGQLEVSEDSSCEELYHYMSNVLIERVPTIVKAFTNEFIDSLLQRCGLNEVYFFITQEYNVVTKGQCIYIFQGYPNGDLLRQVARVLELWNENGKFPVKFFDFSGLEDNTHTIVNEMAQLTPQIQQIFASIQEGWSLM